MQKENKMKLYHYRSIDAACAEIHNGSFQMSTKECLNDPVEGYVKVYWEGDQAAFEGLLRNYVCSLLNIMGLFYLQLTVEELQYRCVMPDIHCFDDAPLGENLKQVGDIFLNDPDVLDTAQLMSETRCTAEQLEIFLWMVHEKALTICAAEIEKHKLKFHVPKRDIALFDQGRHLIHMLRSGAKPITTESETILFHVISRARASVFESSLIWMRTQDNSSEEAESNDKSSEQQMRSREIYLNILYDFPRMYVRQLKELIYPKWFVTCFSATGDNSVMWGNYASGHSGVCLIYETDQNNRILLTEEPILKGQEKSDEPNPAYDEQTLHFRPCEVIPVQYHESVVSRNFFTSMGRFTRNMVDNWLTGHDGVRSKAFTYDNDAWREQYWKDYKNLFNRKMSIWDYEKEYRLIQNDFYVTNDSPRQYFGYEPSQLKGVIFGINTDIGSKTKIMEAVKEKYNDLDWLEWYEAVYDEDRQKINLEKVLLGIR